MKTEGNTILITGGGSGIGAALAHRLHDAGNRVIITGRNEEALERSVAGRENMRWAKLDIDDPQAIAAFAERITAEEPALNVLINNAGIMRHEDVGARSDSGDADAMVTTNLLGAIRMTNALVEHLSNQADAALINVTSGLAFVPITSAAVYSATKAAVHLYTVALRDALKGRVEVIELAPPAVQTELTPGQSQREAYQPLDEFADEVMMLLAQQPTPAEILVERVKFLRFAERYGAFDQTFEQLNAFVREAQAA